ncbi:unnamed protein product [Brassica rapa subsp. narinosa]
MRPRLYLELVVPSSADRRRHFPSSLTAFLCNIQGRAINKICTIEISHSLRNPTDAFRFHMFFSPT